METLTKQNRSILDEMDSHANAHDVVRKHLDRREEVRHLMNSFNRDLMNSKQNLERLTGSPLRQISPYKQNV